MNIGWINNKINKVNALSGIIFITILVSYLQYQLPLKSFDGSANIYTHYNNYVIFKLSHFHLLDNTNIYAEYTNEVHDIFKYSPAFAFVFGIFSRMPDWLGLTLWNMLNTILLVLALMYRKSLWFDKRGWLLLFILPELILTTQHAQSNALMTGLLLLGYFDFEQGKSHRAGIWLSLAVFIKIYAGLACMLFLLYDEKWKFLLSLAISSLFLFLLPLLVVSPASLWMQYQMWTQMLTQDHAQSYGLSLMHILNLIYPGFQAKFVLQLIGVAILALSVFKFVFKSTVLNRLYLLTIIFLTLIIFNHKSESATFILAVVGIAIWFFSIQNPSALEKGLMIFAFFGTVLIASDAFPPYLRNTYFVPYSVKVWPCIIIYMYLLYTLIFTQSKQQSVI